MLLSKFRILASTRPVLSSIWSENVQVLPALFVLCLTDREHPWKDFKTRWFPARRRLNSHHMLLPETIHEVSAHSGQASAPAPPSLSLAQPCDVTASPSCPCCSRTVCPTVALLSLWGARRRRIISAAALLWLWLLVRALWSDKQKLMDVALT